VTLGDEKYETGRLAVNDSPAVDTAKGNNEDPANTIEALTRIWQRVLERSSIDVHENFFGLGSDDSQADAIFAEIAKAFGRELPSATIYHAPTIAALAALLEQPTLPRFSPFVPLKAGSVHPPIVIVHGVGGRASFFELAKHIGTGNPVYGIQARGVDGLQEPFDSIEEMAAFYLDELSQLQSQGPYMLIGYSFGGLVALEMAQRLKASGKKVSLLTFIDTYPDVRYFPLRERLSLFARNTRTKFSEIKQMPAPAAVALVFRAFARRVSLASGNNVTNAVPAPPFSLAHTTVKVKQRDFQTMRRFKPRFYEGKVSFIRPEAGSYFPNSPTEVWKGLVAELEIEAAPGDHLGMIAKHFKTLGAVLTRQVKKACSE
jgi:thioesterase domain-containing protein